MTLNHTQLIGRTLHQRCPSFSVQGRLVSLKDNHDARYLAQFRDEDPKCELHISSSLATVLSLPDGGQTEVTKDWLSEAIKQYTDNDDVWHPAFMQGIVFNAPTSRKANLSAAAEAWLQEQNTEWVVHFDAASDEHKSLRSGAYIVLEGRIREVVRLYPDVYKTMLLALDPDLQSDFAELDFSSSGKGVIDVAVPSRLQSRESSGKPLANVRIAVKDSFHLRNIPTWVSNQAYRDTYGKQPTTAASVKRLVELGCVVVGKTKMTPFGNWLEPVDYIDLEAPWNPRADGYQSSGGSSSGSAAACAAYEWLDIVMGADTAGSVMRPALWGGVFGLRPSFHAVSNSGMAPMIASLDTPCFLGRDILLSKRVASAWYGKNLKRDQVEFGRVIWTSDYWKAIGDEQVRLARRFMNDLEETLGKRAEIVSFEEDWAADPPEEAEGAGLQEYIIPGISGIWYEEYLHAEAFREQYRKLFNKAPYVDPFNSAKWAAASKGSQASCDEAFGRLKVYKNWFEKMYINGKPDAVFILPTENSTPRYRDQSVTTVIKPPPGVNSLFLSPVLGAPELIVPIETIPYQSRVSQREEMLPFAVGLMSAIDTDLALFDLAIKCLQDSGRPTIVKTGKVPFGKQSML